MAMLVRSEHDLLTLRISARYEREDTLDFALTRGRDPAEVISSCLGSEVGPMDLGDFGTRISDHSYRLPSWVLDELRRAITAAGGPPGPLNDALWLEFPEPRGYLYLLPWERLLEDLARPVVRLPYHVVRPQVPSAQLHVALCASSPPTKTGFDTVDVLDRLARTWLEHAGRPVRLHLFTDAHRTADLAGRVGDLATTVAVHHPPVETSSRSRRAQPWLDWIGEVLQGQALDVLHVVGHGYLLRGRGGLALAAAPRMDQATRASMSSLLVGAAELTSFLAQHGAWSCLLSGPAGNYSPAALREIADSVAAAQPGVTLAHDGEVDHDFAQLAGLLRVVYAGVSDGPQAASALTCWLHPQTVAFPSSSFDEQWVSADGTSAIIGTATQEALTRSDTPSWVASGTRYLETLQSQWLPDAPGEQADPAAVAALESVADLLDRHARRHLDERGT
jgi:hypothetical protein